MTGAAAVAAMAAGADADGVRGGVAVCGLARGGGWGGGVLALRGSGPHVQWEREGDGLPAGLWRV